MVNNLSKKFIFSAGILVLAAAAVGFANLFHDTLESHRLLQAKDKFFGLQVRDELRILIGAELIVGALLLLLKNTSTRLWLLVWSVTNFFVVKLALQSQGIQIQNSFIGSLSDPFHLAHGWPGAILSLIPFYLLFGSWMSLGWLGFNQFKARQKKRVVVQTGRGGYWKISCPACGGHVKFALQNEGQKIPCPHCQKAITLCQPDAKLKTSCFFCQGHIEFPAHAIGEKMPCPHCKMDITLKEPV